MISAKEAQKLHADTIEDGSSRTETWINAQLYKIEVDILSAIKRGGFATWLMIDPQKITPTLYVEDDKIQINKLSLKIKELGYVVDYVHTNDGRFRMNLSWKKEENE